MNIERLPEKVVTAATLMIGIILAVLVGVLAGRGSLGTIGIVVGGIIATGLCVALRGNTWLFIPLCWELMGRVPITEIPLAVRDYGVLLAAGSYFIFIALKLIRKKPKLDLIDLALWSNLLYLTSVFIRNPVGLKVFGSEMIGGRPYFNVFVAFLAYAVLVRAPLTVSAVRRLPVVLLLGSVFSSLGSLITYIFPRSAPVLGLLYEGFAPPDPTKTAQNQGGETGRKTGLAQAGVTGMRTLTSYFPPLTLMVPFYFWRSLATAICMVCILVSGFRSSFIAAGLYVICSSLFRRQYRDLFLMISIGLIFVGVAGVGNGRLFNLPLSVQRVLTIFPGNWDSIAVADARDSTQWRLEMWEIILSDDKYIHNRLLGDGFGFSSRDLFLIEQAAEEGTTMVGGVRQENFLVSGMFHSGPLSTIRYVGYVGLGLFSWFMLLLAVRGMRLIKRTRGTELFAPALFAGMPVVIAPLIYFFIAGAFEFNLPDAIFSAGLIKMLTGFVNEQSSATAELKPQPAGYRPRTLAPARPQRSYVR